MERQFAAMCTATIARMTPAVPPTIILMGTYDKWVGLTYYSAGSTMPKFHAAWLHPLPNPVIVPYRPLGSWLRSKSSNGWESFPARAPLTAVHVSGSP